MRVLYNLLVSFSHIVGIIFLEAFCAAKLVWFYDWESSQDYLLILVAVCILVLHYFLIGPKFKHMLSPVCVWLLTVFEFVVSIPIICLLIFPNSFLYISTIEQSFLVFIVQLSILSARTIHFLRNKMQRNTKTD